MTDRLQLRAVQEELPLQTPRPLGPEEVLQPKQRSGLAQDRLVPAVRLDGAGHSVFRQGAKLHGPQGEHHHLHLAVRALGVGERAHAEPRADQVLGLAVEPRHPTQRHVVAVAVSKDDDTGVVGGLKFTLGESLQRASEQDEAEGHQGHRAQRAKDQGTHQKAK